MYHIYQISETNIAREDSLFYAIDGITEKEDSAFAFNEKSSTDNIGDYTARMSLSIYMDRDVTTVTR